MIKMKKIVTIWLGILLISAILVACISQIPADNMLMDILQSKKMFINESGESVYLKDYKIKSNQNIEIKPQKYALIDFDNDGVNELVVYISENYGAYLVFYLYNENVYGFEFPERTMISLKSDGSFIQSEGAGIDTYVAIVFDKTEYQILEKAYVNDMDNQYRLNGKADTLENTKDFTKKFEQKSNVKWAEIN